MVYRIVLLLPLLALQFIAIAQSLPRQNGDSTETINARLVSSYVNDVSKKAGKIDAKLDDYTNKVLSKAQKQEAKLKRKLQKIDSLKGAKIFADTEQQYKRLQEKLQNPGRLQQFIPSLDSLSTSLKFLQENEKLIAATKDGKKKLTEALEKIKGMEGQFQKAEEVKRYLRERKEYLRQQLKGLGFDKELKKLSKHSYYAVEQFNEYKTLLKDQKKAEKKMIALLSKTKLFKDFMLKNSMLASLFRLPGGPDDPANMANLSGLQTRTQITGLIQSQITAGGPNAQQQFRQNIQQAQAQLSELKNKMNQLGKSSSNDEMPEKFKGNPEKVKSFMKRLEYSVNIQSQKANGYFPTQSDIGLSIGYKLNERSIIGLGGSYRVGWGQNIRHIRITQEGAAIRSFVDWKIHGSLWLMGAYEMNYRSAFRNIDELKNLDAWQPSGLLGLSKVVPLKTKLFKKTKLQLMVDFLSFRQVPKTQPVIFRIGYNF